MARHGVRQSAFVRSSASPVPNRSVAQRGTVSKGPIIFFSKYDLPLSTCELQGCRHGAPSPFRRFSAPSYDSPGAAVPTAFPKPNSPRVQRPRTLASNASQTQASFTDSSRARFRKAFPAATIRSISAFVYGNTSTGMLEVCSRGR